MASTTNTSTSVTSGSSSWKLTAGKSFALAMQMFLAMSSRWQLPSHDFCKLKVTQVAHRFPSPQLSLKLNGGSVQPVATTTVLLGEGANSAALHRMFRFDLRAAK